MLVLIALPILLGGAGWIGWRLIQSRIKTCSACGLSTFTNSPKCPACGSFLSNERDKKDNDPTSSYSEPASSVTIDINAEEAE